MARKPLIATTIDKTVWEMAQERMARIFDRMDTIVVSFSGGKDSTVCLNLALDEARRRGRLPLRVMFFDEEAIPYETERFVRRVGENPEISLDWWCIPIAHRNSCSSESAMWYPWAPESENLWVRPMPPEAKTLSDAPQYPQQIEQRLTIPQTNPVLYPPREYGTTGFILGIRSDESVRRRQAVTRREVDNYINQQNAGQYVCYPIYDWSTQDVWRAPKLHGWDYNEAYDIMELAGISHSSQRIAPPYGEQPMQSLWMFKVCFPEIWDRMEARVDGAATAARYARGMLYGAGVGGSKLPVGATAEEWEARLMDLVAKYADGERQWVTKKLLQHIRAHYKRTADPITVRPHPITGISWRMLYKIAEKGDFKSRVVPTYTRDWAKKKQMIQKYNDSLRSKPSDDEQPAN